MNRYHMILYYIDILFNNFYRDGLLLWYLLIDVQINNYKMREENLTRLYIEPKTQAVMHFDFKQILSRLRQCLYHVHIIMLKG